MRLPHLIALTCALPTLAVAQSNLGAVPAHEAIANAKSEVNMDKDTFSIIWGDASISPLHSGWCVVLKGFDRSTAKPKNIPVFVEQDGRAWRTDPAGKAKYDGGADGLYMPPIIAAECRLPKAR